VNFLSPNRQSEVPRDSVKKNRDRSARPFEFDRKAYRDRNIVERLIGWLKESRRIFSRFEKTASNYAGMITMAFIRQFLRYDVEFFLRQSLVKTREFFSGQKVP